VSTLLGRVVTQVYQDDVERAIELVFSLMHIDLVACTLSLIVQVLPCLISGPEEDTYLSYPYLRALARLLVCSLGACLSVRGSMPRLTARQAVTVRDREAELQEICNGQAQPVKLRRLVSGHCDVREGSSSSCVQEQLLEHAHQGLFSLLSSLATPCVSPRLELLATVLEEAVLSGGQLARSILQPLQFTLIMQVVKLQPSRFSSALLLRMFDSGSSQGRKNAAKVLCLVRNSQALKQAYMPEL